MRRMLLLVAVALLVSSSRAQDAYVSKVQIGVFGLFHPHELTLQALPGQAVVLHAGRETLILDGSGQANVARLILSEGKIAIDNDGRITAALEIRAGSRSGEAADFVLAVPGKIQRHYRGTLLVKAHGETLIPVVSMDLETAVASAVQAESPPEAPLEALKAQAVASRSYFVAGAGRHEDFDFCDTTHCQFLREPSAKNSLAAVAAAQTRGLILSYNEHTFAPMFTRSCGGQTQTAHEIGLAASSYPYFSVVCKFCREHPVHWQAHLSQNEAEELRSKGESARLDIDRRLGWSTVLSNNFTTRKDAASRDGSMVVVEGIGQGHGAGLCQLGSKAMAENGAGFQEILEHYYPNTKLREISSVRMTNRTRPTISPSGN